MTPDSLIDKSQEIAWMQEALTTANVGLWVIILDTRSGQGDRKSVV